MTTYVQVCGCVSSFDETTPFVSDKDAQFYGVYIGEPGAFRWIADFASKDDALNWAEEVADNQECELEDKTYDQETTHQH